jgi:hypothetical protein
MKKLFLLPLPQTLTSSSRTYRCSHALFKLLMLIVAHRYRQDGYDTLVGTSVSSMQLSGGQRQRLCIARCLIRRPRVMLFDEATSALDSQSEFVVQKSIDELLKAKERPTSVVVAHRLSTIIGCDCICVLQRGRLVESGTHSELMQKPDGLCAVTLSFLLPTVCCTRKTPVLTPSRYFLLQKLQHLHHAPATPVLSPSHSPSLDPTTGAPPLDAASSPPADDVAARERAASLASTDSASIEMTEVVENTSVVVKDEFSSDASEGRVWRMQMDRWCPLRAMCSNAAN